MSELWPEHPKELLEKRYKAFESGNVDFIIESHHPETRDQVEPSAVENWSTQSRWKGLEIGEVKEDKDKCFIHFTAKYERDFETIAHTEWAEFRKADDGRWYYFDSEFPRPETVRREGSKLGRNDPCHCGSGKKFKKCHGQAA